MKRIVFTLLLMLLLTSCQAEKTNFEPFSYIPLIVGEKINTIPANWTEVEEDVFSYQIESCELNFFLSDKVLTRKTASCVDSNDYSLFYPLQVPEFEQVVSAFSNFAQLPTTYYVSTDETVDRIQAVIPYSDFYLEYLYSPNQVYLTHNTLPEIITYFPNTSNIPLEINQQLGRTPFAWKWVGNSLYTFYPGAPDINIYGKDNFQDSISTDDSLTVQEVIQNYNPTSQTDDVFLESFESELKEIQQYTPDSLFSALSAKYSTSSLEFYLSIEDDGYCKIIGNEDDLFSYQCTPTIQYDWINSGEVNPQKYIGLSKSEFLDTIEKKNKVSFTQPQYNRDDAGNPTTFLFRPESVYWVVDEEKIITVTVKDPNYTAIRDSKNGHDYVRSVSIEYYHFNSLTSITEEQFNLLIERKFLINSLEEFSNLLNGNITFISYKVDEEQYEYAFLYMDTLFVYSFDTDTSEENPSSPVLIQLSENFSYLNQK